MLTFTRNDIVVTFPSSFNSIYEYQNYLRRMIHSISQRPNSNKALQKIQDDLDITILALK